MKKNFALILFTISVIGLTLTSCGKVPQVEIDSATASIETLKTQQADVYVAAEFVALQDSLNVAIENVEKVKSKFMFRNYDAPKAQLAAVVATATELGEKTEAAKVLVKEETLAALESAQTILAENKKLVEKAPKGKEGKAAIDAIKSELAVLETALAETGALLEGGSFMAAKDKVTAATEKLNAINTELKEVIAKVKR